jgi:hypothetical protein
VTAVAVVSVPAVVAADEVVVVVALVGVVLVVCAYETAGAQAHASDAAMIETMGWWRMITPLDEDKTSCSSQALPSETRCGG